jgi:hypothetical protein
MSKFQRNKGLRVEREIVNWHKEHGIRADRVPLSGASRYQDEGHDVNIYPPGYGPLPLVCEVKARADGAGFKLLRRWLGEHDALFVHEDREEDLVVLPKRTWLKLLSALSTSTQPSPNGKRESVTCAKPDLSRGAGRRGEADVHSDEL